jgi:hypothetical protein
MENLQRTVRGRNNPGTGLQIFPHPCIPWNNRRREYVLSRACLEADDQTFFGIFPAGGQ